jgi:predicted CoA-binding protein
MLKNKKTVVIGASPNSDRYSYKATTSLLQHGHTVIPIGIKKGNIHNLEIITDKPSLENIDTVTLYVGPQNQLEWKNYIISLKPLRVIFNPGTENHEFESELENNGIETIQACTLVMLVINQY